MFENSFKVQVKHFQKLTLTNPILTQMLNLTIERFITVKLNVQFYMQFQDP